LSGGSGVDPYYGRDPPNEMKDKNQDIDGNTQRTQTEQKKRKIPEAHKRRPLSEDHRRKLSQAKRGKKRGPLSEEHRRSISKAKLGKKTGPLSEETRRRMSVAQRRRKRSPLTEEHRRKLSDAHRGKKLGPLAEEHRRRISEALKGQKRGPLSEERRRKISDALRGKKRPPRSETHRRKLSEAMRGRKRGPLSEEEKRRRPPVSEECRRKMSQVRVGRKIPLLTRMMQSFARGGKGDYYPAPEDGRDRMMQERQSMRVRARDNSVCQSCGKRATGKDAHAHHLIPVKYWWRMEYYPDEWVVTLCNSCHAATDWQTGFIKWPISADKYAQSELDDLHDGDRSD